jgi:hypothetical protein
MRIDLSQVLDRVSVNKPGIRVISPHPLVADGIRVITYLPPSSTSS